MGWDRLGGRRGGVERDAESERDMEEEEEKVGGLMWWQGRSIELTVVKVSDLGCVRYSGTEVLL